MGGTMFEKIWNRHVIAEEAGENLLYVDRVFIDEGSSHAFSQLDEAQSKVARPETGVRAYRSLRADEEPCRRRSRR